MSVIELIRGGLVVSCQASGSSPLNQPEVIAAMAIASINKGAVGVRIEGPGRVAAVRAKLPNVPVIGLWKCDFADSPVYITPRQQEAAQIAAAGADVIAIDGTARPRPRGEQLADLIRYIQQDLGKEVMADVDTIESGVFAAAAGADLVGTTLYGYTETTAHLKPPGFSLIPPLKARLDLPIICEGGIASPAAAAEALTLGADAVVVGTAITGIETLVSNYVRAIDPKLSNGLS